MNTIILIGRITKEIELKYLNNQQQTPTVTFNLAVNRFNKDEADFPRVQVYGKQAENLQKYCKRGSRIGVIGRIRTENYKDKEGKTQFSLQLHQ